MADIFISYARAERAEAEAIKTRLEDLGLSVFLDVEGLDGGDVFSDVLDREVKTSGVVLGLWSPLALSRPWVQIECDIGKRRGVLVPVAIKPFTDMQVPAAFWNIQFVDLTETGNDPDDANWLKLIKSLARSLKRPELLAREAKSPSHDSATQDNLKAELAKMRSELAAMKGAASVGTKAGSKQTQRRGASVVAIAAVAFIGIAAAVLAGWIVDPFHWRNPASSTVLAANEARPSSPSGSRPVALTADTGTVAPAPAAGPVLSSEVSDAIMTADVARVASALKRGWSASSSVDSESNTALHNLMMVCERNPGHDQAAVLAIAKLLVDAGAKPEQRNKWGDTPLTIARTPKYCGPNHPVTKYLEALTAPAAPSVPALGNAPPPRPAAVGDKNAAALSSAGRRAGEVFRDCPNCPEMVVIPPGSFLMGSPAGETGRSDYEGPQRQVRIGYSFAAGKYEVTWAEYDRCVSDGGCAAATDDGFGKGPRPVTNVNWVEAYNYTAWLTRKTGRIYRLLTEAEWEYAARGGASTAYSWGPEIGKGRAACNGCGSQWDNKSTAPVGIFQPNAYGLYDMHGNVLQWVQDCYEKYTAGQPLDGGAYTKGSCFAHVGRGGSWSSYPQFLRSASRSGFEVMISNDHFGFRVARTL